MIWRAIDKLTLILLVISCCLIGMSYNAGAAASHSGHHSHKTNKNSLFTTLQAEIRRAGAVPKFKAPGPAFSIAQAKGADVWIIPTESSITLVPVVESGMASALKFAGATTTNYTTKGTTTGWVTGMKEAIAAHASAIMLLGIDPTLLKPELAAAKAARIPVVLNYTVPPKRPIPGLITTVNLPFYQAARLMAIQAVLATKGSADILPIGTSSVLQNAGMLNSFRSEVKRICRRCKVEKTLNVQLTAWATSITPDVRNALIANPSINFVAPLYDGMEDYVLPGISQAGKYSKVMTDTFNGTTSVVKRIPSTKPLIGDAGQSNTWIGWATADEVLRVLTHHKIVTETIPLRYWTKANAKQAATVGYGQAFIKGYESLWKA